MGLWSKIKAEAKRFEKRVEKEINRTDENLEKAAKSALKDLPSILLAPTLVPGAWLGEGVVREFDPELADKIRNKRNEAAVAILCGPGEDNAECRRKYREGEPLSESDLSETFTEQDLAKFVDSSFDYIVLLHSVILQSVSDDVPVDKLEELYTQANTAFAEIQRAESIANQFNLSLPEEYTRVVTRAEKLLATMREEIDDLSHH